MILASWGLATDRTWATVAGASAFAAALTVLVSRARGSKRPAAARSADDELARILERSFVRSSLLDHPGDAPLRDLERLRDLARERLDIRRTLDAATERVADVDAALRELVRDLGRDASGEMETMARDLDRDVREGERLQEAAGGAERQLRRLRSDRDTTLTREDALRAELNGLATLADRLGNGTVEAALAEARSRLGAHTHADHLEEELRRGHPGLDELTAQIGELDGNTEAWSVDERALAQARARIEGHEERIESLVRRGEALEGEINHLRDLETVDAVDSVVASLKDEESRLTRERDRKWILARLLREADRRFREEHQPDLLRRASSYLDHLTGGRYQRLIVDEVDGDHLFHLVGPTLPAPVPLAHPVSTGTLEQAYLSLRLAIVDHLDQGGEKLPLFIDEVFVNWDGPRRTRGLELLVGIAKARQVFVFTCHPDLASELEGRGGRVIALDRPG
jgi:uncharacterized protein YhaN